MDQNDVQLSSNESQVDLSMDLNDVHHNHSRDLYGLHEPESQLSYISDHYIPSSELRSEEEPRIPPQGPALSGVWPPIDHIPPIFDSSFFSRAIVMDSREQMLGLFSTETTMNLNSSFEAPPRPIDPWLLSQQGPMDSSFADGVGWIGQYDDTVTLQAQNVVRYPIFQDSAANVSSFLTPDPHPEGCQTLRSISFNFQPQSKPLYSARESSEGIPLSEITYVPPKVQPSQKEEPSLQTPDWEALGNNVRYLSNEGWTKKEMAMAFRASHPGTKVSLGTLDNKFPKKHIEQYSKARPATGRENRDASTTQGAPTPKPACKRPAKALCPYPRTRSVLAWKHSRACFELPERPDPTKEPWNWQYKMLHAIDGLAKGFFDLGTKGWSARGLDFVARNDEVSSLASWQLLSDRCDGIVELARPNIGPKVAYLFYRVLDHSRGLVSHLGPGFLIYFWRICITLSTLRLRRPSNLSCFPFLRKFLSHVRIEMMKQAHAGKSANKAFIEIVDSAIHILDSTPEYLKETVGLGCWKSTTMLSWLVGRKHEPSYDHPLVLRIGVDCARTMRVRRCGVHFKETDLWHSYDILLRGLDDVWSRSSILYDYLYAVSRTSHKSQDVQKLADTLFQLTKGICEAKATSRQLVYDSITRAFAFASRILALSYLETGTRNPEKRNQQRHLTVQYMEAAIEVLRYGDTDCLVVAAMMSKRLEVWSKSYPGQTRRNSDGTDETKTALQVSGSDHQTDLLRLRKRTRGIMAFIEVPPHLMIQGKDECKTGTSKNNVWRRKQTDRKHKVYASLSQPLVVR